MSQGEEMSTTTLPEQTAPEQTAPEQTFDLKTQEGYLAWVETLVDDGADLQPLVTMLVEEKFKTQTALEEVKAHHEEMREVIEILCSPEMHPVVITGVHDNGRLLVDVAGPAGKLRVGVHPDVAREKLRVGWRGLLSCKKNCLLAAYETPGDWTDVAAFEEHLPGQGRMLLRYQENLIAVSPAATLQGVELKKGDLVGFDREFSRLAYTRVEQPGRQHLFFEKTPLDHFEELGGLEEEIRALKWAVEFRLRHQGVADRYRLQTKRGILLDGPPGNGKTKLARCLARFIAGLVPAGECHFMAIAGSSDYSMWLGQSEQKLIARFEAAREMTTRSNVPVVMFFDEIDAIGRRRGSDMGSSAPDRILGTLLAQMDGVARIDNLIVIGATNRADILDPGLLRPGRLGDLKIRIPAPNRAAAAAILRRYLGGLPLVEEMEFLVQALLGRLYSERGMYAEVARVGLRDGSRVIVRGRDLVSGAILENVVRVAAERAADREARGGNLGLTEDDLAQSLDREIRGAVGLLSVANVRGYVTRLPQDRDVVSLESLV